MFTIEDVMVRNVITIHSSQTVKQAADVMCQNEIGSLVVIENDKVVGIVTEKDMLRRVVALARDPQKTQVKAIMSKPPITVGPRVSLDDAVRLMFRHKIKKLPVVVRTEEKSELIGIVTLTDIARLHPGLIKTLKELFEMTQEIPPKRMQKVMNYYIV